MHELIQPILTLPPEQWSNDPVDVEYRHRYYSEAARYIDQLEAENEVLETKLELEHKYRNQLRLNYFDFLDRLAVTLFDGGQTDSAKTIRGLQRQL